MSKKNRKKNFIECLVYWSDARSAHGSSLKVLTLSTSEHELHLQAKTILMLFSCSVSNGTGDRQYSALYTTYEGIKNKEVTTYLN